MSGVVARRLLLALAPLVAACGGSDGGPTGPEPVPPEPGLVFSMRVDGNLDVWFVRADGSDLTRLTDTPNDDFGPTAGGG